MSQNAFQKLQLARLLLQEKKLTKSGKNKFAGYEYFELHDFLPTVQTIFSDVGLCPIYRVGDSDATLTIYNTEKPEDNIVFVAPMAGAELKGCHPVQNLGASISYLRRYLYVNALEIVEHDALDATTGKEQVAPRPVPKIESKPAPKPVEQPIKEMAVAQDWSIKVSGNPGDEDFLKLVDSAAVTSLGFASSEEDVMSIYRVNKQLFDSVKSQDPEFFKTLMDKFSQARNKFKEAA